MTKSALGPDSPHVEGVAPDDCLYLTRSISKLIIKGPD